MHICARTCICRNKYRYLYRYINIYRQSHWCLHKIPPQLQQRIYIPYTICRQCIRIYVYTYVSTQNERYVHVQNVSYTNILYRERNRHMHPYKCLCRCISMADILPPLHPFLVLHIRTFPPSLPLCTYHQQFSDLVVALLRCNEQRGPSVLLLRLHIRLARL